MSNHLKALYKTFLKTGYHLIYLVHAYVPFINKYQAIYRFGGQQSVRSCEDRWAAMDPVLDAKEGSLLDIGSNIGYFSFKAAEKGYLSFGLEAHPRLLHGLQCDKICSWCLAILFYERTDG